MNILELSLDPSAFMKISSGFTNAKGYCENMVGMVQQVVQDAMNMVEKCDSAMDTCVIGTCKMVIVK